MNNEPETDAEKHSFDWLLGRTTMSDTPRTDKAQKEYEDENYDAAVYPEFARQLERELAALRLDNLTAHKMACAAGIERDILRAELAAKDAEADTARLDWLLQDTELDLFFADREEIDAAMKEASK